MSDELKQVYFTYRPELGWCVTLEGASGHHEFIPVKDYCERLHAFYKLSGLPFSPANVIPDALPAKAKVKKRKSHKKRKPK